MGAARGRQPKDSRWQMETLVSLVLESVMTRVSGIEQSVWLKPTQDTLPAEARAGIVKRSVYTMVCIPPIWGGPFHVCS